MCAALKSFEKCQHGALSQDICTAVKFVARWVSRLAYASRTFVTAIGQIAYFT